MPHTYYGVQKGKSLIMRNTSSGSEAFLLSSQKDPVLHYDINLKPGVAYLIYVGEIKAYGLNAFLIPVLEQIYCRPVDCIALIPDVLGRYQYSNLAVLNRESFQYYSSESILVNCRPTAGDLPKRYQLAV